MLQRLAVDDVFRGGAVGERAHRLEGVAGYAGEALVREAQAMRRDDDVVERQDRVVPGRRLDLEDVEPSARDAPGGERLVERALLDDRAPRGVDDVRRGLHQRDLARPDQAARRRAQRAIDRDEVGAAHHLVEAAHELHVQPAQLLGPDHGVVGDVLHLEGHREAEDLGADVAHADQAERPARQAHAHVAGLLRPASLAREPVLQEQLLREAQHEGDDVGRHRASHAVGRDRQHHAPGGAGRHVDRVVADAESRDEPQALVGAPEAGGDHALEHGAERVVARRELGRDLRHWLLQVRPLDPRVVEDRQDRRIVDRPAILAHHVGRDRNPQLVHRVASMSPARIRTCAPTPPTTSAGRRPCCRDAPSRHRPRTRPRPGPGGR